MLNRGTRDEHNKKKMWKINIHQKVEKVLLEQTKYNPIIKMILFFLQHVSFPSFVTHFKAETFLKQNILFINIILE
jgi:hypothetical protein